MESYIGWKGVLGKLTQQNSCRRQARMVRHPLVGVEAGRTRLDKICRVLWCGGWGFLLKLNLTRRCTDGLRKRFRSLTKVWSNKGSLSRFALRPTSTQVVVGGGMLSGVECPCLTSLWQGNLRRLDVQLLGQLCSLGLEMGVLREELVTFLEEENEETLKEEEEDEDPEGKQEEGHLGDSCPAAGYRLPDFEMTI